MPTLRDQLRARRNYYLERIAVFDETEFPEPFDIRVVQCRRFLEGGDDIPPECEEKGVKRERRRLDYSLIDQKEIDAANARLSGPDKNEDSEEGDWDRFLPDGGTDNNLYRITAQLVRATEYWQRNIKLPIDQVLDLKLTELPQLRETTETMPKAWALLRACGCDLN